MNETFKNDIKKLAVITIAAFIKALDIKMLVRTGGLYPGGAMGLTLLVQAIAERCFQIELSYTVINLILNAVPVYIGFRFIGKKITFFSCVMLFLTGFFTDIIPTQIITHDVLLIAVFGGIINGVTIVLCLLAGGTSGGTDFISIYLSEKKGVDSWNVIFAINVIILLVAGFLFGWDKALYSIIFQFTCTQILHLLHKKYQKQTMFIVTNKPEEICDVIYKICRHGATILEGEGSYEHCKRNVVYSVVSRADSKKILKAVRETDQSAFVNIFRTEELEGRFYQEPTY